MNKKDIINKNFNLLGKIIYYMGCIKIEVKEEKFFDYNYKYISNFRKWHPISWLLVIVSFIYHWFSYIPESIKDARDELRETSYRN